MHIQETQQSDKNSDLGFCVHDGVVKGRRARGITRVFILSSRLLHLCLSDYICTTEAVPQGHADKDKAPSRRSKSVQGQEQKGLLHLT